MKRLICLFFALIVCPVFSLADLPDISGLSFDELVQLQDQINLAMWNSQEWQEVTVPPGTWKIGEDIPAGHWSIRLGVSHGYTTLWYFEQPDEFNKPFARLTKYTNSSIATEDWHAFDKEYIHEVDFDMVDGWYFYNDLTVIFTPYTGKPKLNFK